MKINGRSLDQIFHGREGKKDLRHHQTQQQEAVVDVLLTLITDVLKYFFLYFDISLVLDGICKDEIEQGLVQFLRIIYKELFYDS